jgi:DNA mismatch endonuclease (patch repair protein)
MSAIKGRGNKSTELRFLKLLKENKITGWRRHYKIAGIKPDFVFSSIKLAIFLDGCYWHRCPDHYRQPRTNVDFWESKISSNVIRDRRTDLLLASKKWQVLHIWEHELKDEGSLILARLKEIL